MSRSSLGLPPLLLLTDRSQLHLSRSLTATLGECVAAGASAVVVRELDEAPEARAALVRQVTDLGGVAIAAHTALPGAAGVHLPSGAAVVGGPFGRSCHSAAEVHVAAEEGAAWVTLSPYADSASKPGRTPLSPREYADAARAGIPVYALGGVTAANAAAAREAGAHGVAVMGEVMRAADPGAVVADLLEAIA